MSVSGDTEAGMGTALDIEDDAMTELIDSLEVLPEEVSTKLGQSMANTNPWLCGSWTELREGLSSLVTKVMNDYIENGDLARWTEALDEVVYVIKACFELRAPRTGTGRKMIPR